MAVRKPPTKLEDVRQTLATRPDDPVLHFKLGALLVQMGDPGGAVAAFRQALRLKADFWQARLNLGSIYFLQSRKNEGMEEYLKVLQQFPDNLTVRYNLGQFNFDEGNTVAAMRLFEQVIKQNPRHVDGWNSLALCYQHLRRFREGVSAARKVVELLPEVAWARVNLAIALRNSGELGSALAELNIAADRCPDDFNVFFEKGLLHCLLEQPERATTEFRRAVQIDPANAAGHNNLGYTLFQQQQYEAARSCYDRAIELDPNYGEAINNLAELYEIKGEYRRAVTCLRRLLTLAPYSVETYFNLGMIQYRAGDLVPAEQDLKTFVSLWEKDDDFTVEAKSILGKIAGRHVEDD